MIGELLPSVVTTSERHGHEPGDDDLHPEEAAVVAHAAPRRRQEFADVRACARAAMAALGVPPQPLLPGERGAPRWPAGVVGSMTHCAGYRAAVCARAGDLAAVGIDAEPHLPVPDGVLRLVASPDEHDHLDALTAADPAVHWGRLLFSAKEAVYKAWFPLTGRPLGFRDAALEIARPTGPGDVGAFRARLLVPGPVVAGRATTAFEGRWSVRDGLVRCAVAVPHT